MQEEAGCIIGKDYPAPMVDHKTVAARNCSSMVELQKMLHNKCNMVPDHIKPSDEAEVKKFFNLNRREGYDQEDVRLKGPR